MGGYFDLSHAISISVLSVDMRYCLLVMSFEAGVNRVGHEWSGILRGWFYFSSVSTRDGVFYLLCMVSCQCYWSLKNRVVASGGPC